MDPNSIDAQRMDPNGRSVSTYTSVHKPVMKAVQAAVATAIPAQYEGEATTATIAVPEQKVCIPLPSRGHSLLSLLL